MSRNDHKRSTQFSFDKLVILGVIVGPALALFAGAVFAINKFSYLYAIEAELIEYERPTAEADTLDITYQIERVREDDISGYNLVFRITDIHGNSADKQHFVEDLRQLQAPWSQRTINVDYPLNQDLESVRIVRTQPNR